MARTPKATLVSIEDAGPPPERDWNQMSAEEQRAAFVEKVMAQRAADAKAEEPPPRPGLTERQRAQIEAEMKHGAEVAARNAAKMAVRPPPERHPAEGYTVPVFRPEDYVPNMNQGQTASVSVKSKNL